mgnify:CR=1 FL=1
MGEPSPLLMHTVDNIVVGLRKSDQIEMNAEHHDSVVEFVAVWLANAGMGCQLVDSLSKALVACEWVEELYATDEEIKDMLTEVSAP